MMKVLVVNACVRVNSRTYELTKCLLDKLKTQVKDINIEEIKLENEKISNLDGEILNFREECIQNKDYSNDMFTYAKQFANADIIVLAAPYWDLSFPAMVKTYLEAVSVRGITFEYTKEGRPSGLCKAQKFYYVTTSGGSMQFADLGWEYTMKLVKMLYGIEDIKCIRAENLDIIGSNVNEILEEAKKHIN